MEIEDELVTQNDGPSASEDYGRYIKMALRIAPKDYALLFK